MFAGLPSTLGRLSLAGTLVCTVLPACAQKLVRVGEAHFAYDLSGNRVPGWNGGFLFPVERNGLNAPIIHVIDETGMEASPIVFSVPDASAVWIEAVARGLDGRYAVGGRAYDRDGKGGGFVSWVSPDGKIIKILQTYPYIADEITVAPDGTTWAKGFEVVHGKEWVGSSNGLIRRFDSDGKLMGKYIPRNSVPHISSLAVQQGKFACNKDRVGWYASRAHDYVELEFNGNKVSSPVAYPGIAARDDVHSEVTGMAIMSNGDVYISAEHGSRQARPVIGMYRLDRQKRSWIAVDVPPNPDGKAFTGAFILGGDGQRIVLLGSTRSIVFVSPLN